MVRAAGFIKRPKDCILTACATLDGKIGIHRIFDARDCFLGVSSLGCAIYALTSSRLWHLEYSTNSGILVILWTPILNWVVANSCSAKHKPNDEESVDVSGDGVSCCPGFLGGRFGPFDRADAEVLDVEGPI